MTRRWQNAAAKGGHRGAGLGPLTRNTAMAARAEPEASAKIVS